jgi:hypothetical protein
MPVADVEDDEDVRFIGSLSGCYSLSSREAAASGAVKVFACRVKSISASTVILQAPLSGPAGEMIALHLDGVGLLRACISRPMSDGFIAALDLHGEHRQKLISRIRWLKRRHMRAAPEKRHHKRWLPRDPHSSLVLPDDRTLPCFIIDLSISGVALSADLDPAIGAPVGGGSILGRVVRGLSCGFAIQFATPQPADAVEHLLGTLTPARRTAMVRAMSLACQGDTPAAAPIPRDLTAAG